MSERSVSRESVFPECSARARRSCLNIVGACARSPTGFRSPPETSTPRCVQSTPIRRKPTQIKPKSALSGGPAGDGRGSGRGRDETEARQEGQGGTRRERVLFIDNLLVRIHVITEMMYRAGFPPWELAGRPRAMTGGSHPSAVSFGQTTLRFQYSLQ